MAGPVFSVVSCEHASAAVPPELGSLGLAPEILNSHVAWDPGAKEWAEAVAEAFGAPLFLGRHTRLLADLNRHPDNEDVLPAVAFGVQVPANQGLSPSARADRLARYHAPHWSAVGAAVERGLETGPVVHWSVHSFDPGYGDAPRPWDFGLLVDRSRPREAALAGRILDTLRADGWSVDYDVPYSGTADYLVTDLRRRYADAAYAGILVEVSQKHLDDRVAIGRHLSAALRRAVDEGGP